MVAAGLAEQCEVQLAYAIGVAEPVSIRVDTFGTGAADEAAIEAAVEQVFDLRPASIIEQLGLRRPIYRQLTAIWDVRSWALHGSRRIKRGPCVRPWACKRKMHRFPRRSA